MMLTTGSFIRQFLFYLSYTLTQVLIHLVLVSIIAFFHFLLEHKMGVIEGWIYNKNWEIIIATKVLAAAIVFKFLEIRSDSRHLVRDLIQKSHSFPPRELLILIITLFLLFIWLGSPHQNEIIEFKLYRFIISFLGTFIFFFSDFFIIYVLDSLYPLKSYFMQLRNILCSIALVLFVPCLFSNHSNPFTFFEGIGRFNDKEFTYSILLWVFFHSFTMFLLGLWRKKSLIYPSLYLLFLVCPFASFFGVDFIWGKEFSYFFLREIPGYLELFPIFLVFYVYLYFFGRSVGE